MSRLKVIHVVAGLWKDTGGPAEVIPNLCAAQVAAGAEVTLCSINGDNAPQLASLSALGVDLRLFPSVDKTLRFSPSMRTYLRSRDDVDVIHNHGHWLWPNWYASSVTEKLKVPLVTTPHGTLVSGMLSRSRIKKWFAWNFFDAQLIKRAAVIHALSPAEMAAMEPKIGASSASKLRVVANGVNSFCNAGQNVEQDGGVLLFLSRVTAIKGILPLLLAWRLISDNHKNWSLRIVGPHDPAISDEIRRLCDSAARVQLVGPIYAEERWREYSKAAAFILPTFGEGLPTVLLEAAAHRLPIITTPEANFPELNRRGGSILTSAEPEALALTLSQFFQLKGSERRKIGLQAENLISEKYGWQTIAEQWLNIYREVAKDVDA